MQQIFKNFYQILALIGIFADYESESKFNTMLDINLLKITNLIRVNKKHWKI